MELITINFQFDDVHISTNKIILIPDDDISEENKNGPQMITLTI